MFPRAPSRYKLPSLEELQIPEASGWRRWGTQQGRGGPVRVLKPPLLTARPQSPFTSVLTISEALSCSRCLPCPKHFWGILPLALLL